ncbi:MAG: phosphate ABC transporter substrate-binding protein [Burkholderiales bacterium]|nr:phosphate ABC transporter substrate-binding protein [Burkholderiales bacterium]MDE2432333.1 phosphate ABC transporter substrate-binding protein [Burkholderiales bacterium]
MKMRNGFAGLMLLSTLLGAWADPVVIVNPKVTVKLSDAEVKNLYLGAAKGLPDGTSIVLLAVKSGPTRDEFMTKVLGRTETQYRAVWSRLMFTGTGQPPKEIESDDEVKRLVAHNPNLMGFIDSSKLDDSIRDASK